MYSTGNAWIKLGPTTQRNRPLTFASLGDSITAVENGLVDIFNYGNTSAPNFSIANAANFYGLQNAAVRYTSSWNMIGCARTNRRVMPYQFIYGQSGSNSTTVSNATTGTLAYLLAAPSNGFAFPDFVEVLCGTNDTPSGSNLSLATTLANLSTIYQTLQSYGILPIACLLPPRSDGASDASQVRKINEGVCRLAQKYRIPVSDFWSPLANGNTGFWGNAAWNTDNVHPLPRACAIMGAELGLVLNNLAATQIVGAETWNDSVATTDQTGNANFGAALGGGSINTAGSYPGSWASPAVTTTVFNGAGAAEQGTGWTMLAGPTVGGDSTTPYYLGNSWQLQGTGTSATYGGTGPAVNAAAGNLIAMRARVKFIPNYSAGSLGQADIRLINSNDGTPVAGLASVSVGGGVLNCGLGNEAAWPAADYYMEFICPPLTSGATSLSLRVQLNNAAGNGTNTGDTLVIANLWARNLTTLGIS